MTTAATDIKSLVREKYAAIARRGAEPRYADSMRTAQERFCRPQLTPTGAHRPVSFSRR